MNGSVVAVAAGAGHRFSKAIRDQITLVDGLGVEGDAHCGVMVKHRSRVAQDPTQPNLRQVHLIHGELFEELAGQGYHVSPGQIGENIVTRGLQLLALPAGARLHVGASAVLCLTGLRNPCAQLDQFRPGLMSALLGRGPDGELVRKAGVMAVVAVGGMVRAGDAIMVRNPAPPHRALERV